MSNIDGPGEPSAAPSFRDRLNRIPDAPREPVDDWAEAAPPVVRRTAPVARPAQSYEDQVPYEQPPVTSRDGPNDQEFEPIGTRRRKRRWPLLVGLLMIVLLLAVLIPVFMVRQTFDSVPRVNVSEALTEPVPEGRNILLVGTDSRAGIDADTENSGVILGDGMSEGSPDRSDTIMVLRLEESGSKFLSLPRDLWLPINGGGEQRINTAIAQGPEALIATVQQELGLPISHYVQVDLAGFIDLVDAVGGVDITIEHPAFDRKSGLDLPSAGTVTLDSAQALAWVRSRAYTEIIDGREVVDGTGDIGRVARQQEFMRALMTKVTEQRNPITLNDMAASMGAALTMDDATSLSDALEIANTMRSGTPDSVELPTSPDTRSGNSVLVLRSGADEVLRSFGAQ